MNIEVRKNAKNIFIKILENLKKHTDIRLVTTKQEGVI